MIIPPFAQIKLYYEFMTPEIMERQRKHVRGWVSPYGEIKWELYFSPIEEQTWMALRTFGQAPMYPQYPALKYFLDFANPFMKVAIECDGKEFHKNKLKDFNRDEELFNNGWKVYRISGSDCYRTPSDEYYDLDYLDEDDKQPVLKEFYFGTVEGLIKAIAIFHFDYFVFNQEINELDIAYDLLRLKCDFDKRFLSKKYDEILNKYYEYEYQQRNQD